MRRIASPSRVPQPLGDRQPLPDRHRILEQMLDRQRARRRDLVAQRVREEHHEGLDRLGGVDVQVIDLAVVDHEAAAAVDAETLPADLPLRLAAPYRLDRERTGQRTHPMHPRARAQHHVVAVEAIGLQAEHGADHARGSRRREGRGGRACATPRRDALPRATLPQSASVTERCLTRAS
jgi:hypothetical protein